MKPNEFVQAFVQAASQVVGQLPSDAYSLSGSSTSPPATLKVKPSSGGFPIEMHCETYGVYPSALGWRDGCWDVTVFRPGQIADMTKEFLTSVLSPTSSLELHKSNGKPYKFVLHYTCDGKLIADKYGTRFYNWFGAKAIETLRNNWLRTK